MVAAIVAAMTIPAYAAETTVELPAQVITATNLLTITYRNKNTNFSINSSSGYYTGLYIENTFEKDNTFVITASITVTYASLKNFFGNTMDILKLENGKLSNLSSYDIISGATMNYVDDGNTRQYIITFNTSNIDSDTYNALYFLTKSNITSSSNVNYNIYDFSVYSTYDPTGTTLDDINVQINNVINNISNTNQKLDEIIINQENNNTEIIRVLNDILSNQEIQNENWQTLINYGNNYDQIDQTTINNFQSAESQLSSAEGAVRNKSGSLKDSVSSQWSEIKTAATTFPTTIAPAAAAITTIITDITAVMPQELQAALLAIPLIIFIGWLIGKLG